MINSKTSWPELKKNTPELLREIIKCARTNGLIFAANKYATRIPMPADRLTNSLRGWRIKYGWASEDFDLEMLEIPPRLKTPPVPRISKEVALPPMPTSDSLALTDEEAKFLEDYRKGNISFEQVQREFAYRVLKKVMQNPELLKVNDWLKSEVIKIQREELSMKKEEMERSWALLFGSFHIEKFCPNCGYDLFPTSDINQDLKISETFDVTDIKSS